jgi:SagB-type dehydrogenase family enzyme
MKRIDLANPVLRPREKAYSEFCYPVIERTFLPQPTVLPKTLFSKVLASRQSRRDFKPTTERDLNALLWHSARALEVAPPARSSRWQHRPAASAGGRHPIDILIIERLRDRATMYLYQPEPHSLAKIRLASDSLLEHFLDSIDDVVNAENATIVWLAAQFDRTLSRYQNGESLVWRDSGVLLATVGLVAECLDLNCCAVGITGEPFISAMLKSKSKVIGIGGILLGRRS